MQAPLKTAMKLATELQTGDAIVMASGDYAYVIRLTKVLVNTDYVECEGRESARYAGRDPIAASPDGWEFEYRLDQLVSVVV
jgi:hypothetical protein